MTVINNNCRQTINSTLARASQASLRTLEKIAKFSFGMLVCSPLALCAGISTLLSSIALILCDLKNIKNPHPFGLNILACKVYRSVEKVLDFTFENDKALLCRTKNTTSLHTIWHEKDLKTAYELLKTRKDPLPIYIGGICLGACLTTIKMVLEQDIKNEEELIALISKNRDGFSHEASAVQLIFKNLLLKSANTCLDKTVSLIDLKQTEETDLSQKGSYLLVSRSSKHATALLNLPFGTYLMDPNKGLYRWNERTKSEYKIFNEIKRIELN